ncbi:ATPase family AAA domain-containing protein 5b isoform X2 [Cheilinus undulatus]|uniref:ATPase family AAA domain-containing protein 5b isoform X2 n=1 Tax=Cheilinus undulatus TaxID=241271 RepID=UPI001BD5CE86|nr:ATPase family AAA domain-containing protein 5b isoform X2 [Cheilinus undulatus]
MQKKLKQIRKFKDATTLRNKEKLHTGEVLIVFSESSCSGDEALSEDEPASLVAQKTNVASGGNSIRRNKPPPELRETSTTKDIKIAPVFLHTARHRKTKRRSNGKLDEPKERLQKSEFPPQSEDVQQVENHHHHVSAVSPLTRREKSCRGHPSASDLHICLEEIQTCNPAFPVRSVFTTLQRKASDRQSSSCKENCPNISSFHLKEKRKHRNESSERVLKRLKSEGTRGHCHIPAQDVQESPVLMAKKQPRGNRLSRTHRLRQQTGSPSGLVTHHDSNLGLINHTESNRQSLKIPDIPQEDLSCEDVLWTDKYSPQHSTEVIGNSVSVHKLQNWLKKWKLRADNEERRKVEERKEANRHGSWDCGDFLGEAETDDEPLCNTMLITGPPGVGKTASVYACAQELGFKVFEVNCSSQRSGHHVLSQLKEATQSHLVETSEKDPLKPAYFNNYNCTPKADTLPGKTVTPKNATSSSKKRAAQSLGCPLRKGRTNPAAFTLANYFKTKNKVDLLHSGGPSPTEKPDEKKSDNQTTGCDQSAPQYKKTATSLILFEEVDVIFDDDFGFLAAIKTFMTTTKRPVILTTNDPLFRERFKCSMEEITFKAPSEVNVCTYLQLVALSENTQLQFDDVSSLLRLSRGDVRRCLLQLQLWVQSSRGQVSKSGGLPKESINVYYPRAAERGNYTDTKLLQFDTGCTASMLGLHSATLNKLQNLLWFCSEADMNELLRLLAESWIRAVPLLYSNLELLLPFRDMGTSGHSPNSKTCSGQQSELPPSDIYPHIQQPYEVSATVSKSCRTISRLSRRKYTTPVLDTKTNASLSKTPPETWASPKSPHQTAQQSSDTTEKNAAKSVTDYMEALTNFFDLMSYIDAAFPADIPAVSGSCTPEAFVWTGAETKDGMLDEMREEEEEEEGCRRWSKERHMDIQAAVEVLGCHKWRMLETRSKAQKYRQELGDTEQGSLVERQSLSFSFPSLCAPSVTQRRYELSKKVLCSKSFSLLGNRRAVSIDYMPVLRYICSHQRMQQPTERPRRCRNYLSSSSHRLGLSKSTIQLLKDFP